MKAEVLIKVVALFFLFSMGGCVPKAVVRTENKSVPAGYTSRQDTVNTARLNWHDYFNDPNLAALIDTALANNQEFNIVQQEIEIARNEVRARKGEYLPFVNLAGGGDYTQEGAYTTHEAIRENVNPSTKEDAFASNSEFTIGAVASWEIDIWKKLRNAKKSAALRYLGSIEGRNFMQTTLVAEIASSYYELMALDNLLEIVEGNIKLQSDALKIVRAQKESARVTELAVNRFTAQLLRTQNLRYDIRQRIVEAENRINFLTGRYPKSILRNSTAFISIPFDSIQAGIPSQLLSNRPDIRKAEVELAAAKLDVKVARAHFYPSLSVRAGIGYQAFNPKFLINPESVLLNAAGELVAPLVNRNALMAAYNSANARQLQMVYAYEQTILHAYLDVLNQLSKIDNYNNSFQTKNQEVSILLESVIVSTSLFNSARADYGEVLFTQREALESKMDLVEIKLKQLNAKVNIYLALGGGWN